MDWIRENSTSRQPASPVFGLFLIMLGMLVQWPTIITALMFPVLVYVYYRLSKREERK